MDRTQSVARAKVEAWEAAVEEAFICEKVLCCYGKRKAS